MRRVFLRQLVAEDIAILRAWENDPSVWRFSVADEGDKPPYSDSELRRFIENQQLDIGQTGQVRFVVCVSPDGDSGYGRPIGFVDLFDYDREERTAGVGILIYREEDRRKNYGTQAVKLICDLASENFKIMELWCNVDSRNEASLRLFLRAGFSVVDSKKVALRKIF